MRRATGPRLTLKHLMTLPVFAAAAIGCIVIADRTDAVRQYGWVTVILTQAIVIPVAMALVAHVVLARTLHRDRLVAALMLCSTLAGVLTLLVIASDTAWEIVIQVVRERGLPVDLLAYLMVLSGGLLGLLQAARVLRRQISPTRCPHCGDPATRPEPLGSSPSRLERGTRVCEACGLSFSDPSARSPRAG